MIRFTDDGAIVFEPGDCVPARCDNPGCRRSLLPGGTYIARATTDGLNGWFCSFACADADRGN